MVSNTSQMQSQTSSVTQRGRKLNCKLQMEGTTFSYTFVVQGYDKKLSDPDKQPEEEPKKKLVVKCLGPGR